MRANHWLGLMLLVGAASIGLYLVNDTSHEAADRQVSSPLQVSPEAKHFGQASSANQPPSIAVVPTDEAGKVPFGSTELAIDFEAGENDPRIMELAEKSGESPRCLVEGLRAQMELLEYMKTNPDFNPVYDHYEFANPVSEECVQERRNRLVPSPPAVYEVSNSAYEQYSNEQLEALAPYEADAAMLLARRTEDDRNSRRYYELATQITQDAKPLDEWLLSRGGIEHINGLLTVEPAKLGYETALIAEAFGSALGTSREMYRDALVEEGIDLTPIEASARKRIAELKERKQ